MLKKILNAASWLGLVQVMNVLSAIVLSVVVIRHSDESEVASYMLAVFLTEAALSYCLLQIAQRLTLAKDDYAFRQLFAYSRRFSIGNALLAIAVVAVAVGFSEDARQPQVVYYIAWLAVAGIANYFAQIWFSTCDYHFDYKSLGVSAALSNVLSLGIAVVVFVLGGGIASMVVRDVTRGLIFLALALRTNHAVVQQLSGIPPLDRDSKVAFLGFLMKRHGLKVIEVSNHRVPALVTSVGNLGGLANFGVAFQLISQIMSMLTVAGDKVAYSFFSRGQRESKLKYLLAVVTMYAVVGLTIFFFGGWLFNIIYGQQWANSSRIFSWLGLYLFTHGSLVVITNYLITEQRFAGIYVSWAGWSVTFLTCFLIDRTWPIVGYYLTASAVSFVLALGSLLVAQSKLKGTAGLLPGSRAQGGDV